MAGTVAAEVVSRTGCIDIFVNNAGGALIGGAEESSVEQAQAIFDLNVWIVRTTNEVLPIMRRQRICIINISSVVGFIPVRSALYTATKHAVEGY